ncbi:GTPase, partial [Acidobacteriota bacterium]
DLIVTDTVGFIRELPPDLIAAFRSTLEELSEADLLLHVVDLSSRDKDEQIRCVDEVLDSLELEGIPRLLVFNKLDRVAEQEGLNTADLHGGVAVSALEGTNLDNLVSKVRETLLARFRKVH